MGCRYAFLMKSHLGNAKNWFVRFGNNKKGTSFVELALVAPVLMMLVLGIGDLGYGYSKRYFLQQALNRTIEMGQLGSASGNYDHLKPEIAAAAEVPESNVTLERWLECDNVRRDITASCDPGQRVARYLSLAVWKSHTPLFGTAGYTGVQADGTIRMEAMASLRTD